MSGIATGTALAIGLGAAGTAASVGTSLYGANQQAGAAKNAADLQYQAQQQALGQQATEWNQTQANQAPFLQAGQNAVGQLSQLTSTPGQGLLAQYPGSFTAPTAQQAQQTPGYQFTYDQGLQALDRGAAARGNLLGGGTMQAEQQYGQGLASQTYQQTFNNALTQYQNAYNQFQQGQANTYNRLAGLAGTGQTAANTLGSQGQAAAQNAGSIYVQGANNQANSLQNQAYQTASGYNAAAGGLNSGLGNILQNYQLMGALGNSQNQLPGSLQLGTEVNQGLDVAQNGIIP